MAEDLLAHRAILQAGGWQLIDLVKQVDKTAHQIWIQPTLNTEHLSCRIRHSAAEQQDTHFLVSIPVTARRALDALAALDPTIPPEQTESAYPALAEFGASVHAAAAANPEEPGELLAPGHEHAPEEPLTSEDWLDPFAAAGWECRRAIGDGPAALARLELSERFGQRWLSVTTEALDHRKRRQYRIKSDPDHPTSEALELLADWAGRFTVDAHRDAPFQALVDQGHRVDYVYLKGSTPVTVEL